MECRITSEDPANGFLPSTGRISYLRPPAGPGIRWDSGVETGDEVTLYYDSMLAKLIVHGADRADAIVKMERALRELVVVGVATNQSFHLRLLADPDFRAGRIDIQFLERRPDLAVAAPNVETIQRLAAAAALAEHERRQRQKPAVATDGAGESAWLGAASVIWRMAGRSLSRGGRPAIWPPSPSPNRRPDSPGAESNGCWNRARIGSNRLAATIETTSAEAANSST